MLCAVFFTLGYVMGRTQFAPSVNANGRDTVNGLAPSNTNTPPPVTHPDNSGSNVETRWNFEDKDNVLQPASKPAPAPTNSKSAKPVNSTKPAPAISPAEAKELKKYGPPAMKRGSIILQLAALSKESDATSMVDELQRKRFPSFVITSASDTLYHVQVGPYSDMPSAEKAKAALGDAGFKAIIKR